MSDSEYHRFLADIPFPKVEIERLKWRMKEIASFVKPGSIIAEIGVFRGHFSEVILESLKPSVFYMVDPWTLVGEVFGWGEEGEYTAFGKLTTQQAKDDAARRVEQFSHTEIHIHEMRGEAFADELKRTGVMLDAVYIDAAHTHAAVLADLCAFQDVIALDGLILGDDWTRQSNHKHSGVALAVNDFVKETDFDIVIAGPATQFCLRRRLTSTVSTLPKGTHLVRKS